MELQRGVVGPDAMMKALVERVSAAGTVRAAAAVCDAARGVGARVVHCVVHTREDGAGTAANCRILGLADKLRGSRGSLRPSLEATGRGSCPSSGTIRGT